MRSGLKKIGFDATSIVKKNHDGGKNQVLLNLLRGFEKNGVADKFVIFCIAEMEDVILKLIRNAVVVPIPLKKIWSKRVTEFWARTFILPEYINQYEIGVLLFPASNTGVRSYPFPTVVIPHDIQSQTNKDRYPLSTRLLDAFCYHFDFRLRDKIVAISNFDKQEILSKYPLHRGKIIQIYNPIYTDLLKSTGIYKSGKPYITAVNIRYRHKNTITLIKAFDMIKNIIPHDLCLIGKTKAETAHLVSYVREHGLIDRVIFKGFIDDALLAEILKGSALYVNPSLFEGFGMTTVEAMLAGVPALASSVSAVPEITMGLCNYYEPADDAEALAEAMKKILLEKDHTNASQLKIISSKIDGQYNYIKISRQYYDLLTSLMQG